MVPAQVGLGPGLTVPCPKALLLEDIDGPKQVFSGNQNVQVGNGAEPGCRVDRGAQSKALKGQGGNRRLLKENKHGLGELRDRSSFQVRKDQEMRIVPNPWIFGKKSRQIGHQEGSDPGNSPFLGAAHGREFPPRLDSPVSVEQARLKGQGLFAGRKRGSGASRIR